MFKFKTQLLLTKPQGFYQTNMCYLPVFIKTDLDTFKNAQASIYWTKIKTMQIIMFSLTELFRNVIVLSKN